MDKTIGIEKPLEDRQSSKHHIAPVLVLLVLAPVVSELLLGDIGFNASFPFLLLLDLSYYGTGAILIREVVRRRGLHWSWIPVLAFAYGLLEEGLVLHSLFNPNFPGIGLLGFYGRALGVDWVWASFVLGLHTVWSISVPILLTELLFPKYRKEHWLGNVGLSVTCVIFVLGMAFLAFIYAKRVTPDFKPEPVPMICTALLVLAILLTALFVPVRSSIVSSQSDLREAPNPWLVGVATFLLGGIFLFAHEFYSSSIPSLLAILLNLVLAVVAVVLIRRWSASDRRWDDTHRVALAFSALLGYCAFGFEVVSPDITNMLFHGVLSVITIVLMVVLTLKVRARVAVSS